MLVLVVAQDVHTGQGSSLLAADPIGASTPYRPTLPISKSARGCSLYVSSLGPRPPEAITARPPAKLLWTEQSSAGSWILRRPRREVGYNKFPAGNIRMERYACSNLRRGA